MLKKISSKIVHKNPYFNVTCEKFAISKNKIGTYFLLNQFDSSIIIPLKNNKIIFEKQFRYPIKKWSLELPCGAGEKDLNPKQNALKELREETEYSAKNIKKVGKFYPSPGRSGYSCSIFLATDLKFIGERREEAEIIKTVEFSIKEVYELIDKRKITDAYTLSALAIAKNLLLK